jgi:prepilin-type N-terminal cleavage/methylation domain-containing protein
MNQGPTVSAQSRGRQMAESHGSRGFTLIELMIVMAIVGIVMVIGIPSFVKVWHKDALRKSVADVVEVCSHARARAILQGSVSEVVFHAKDGRFEVVSAVSQSGEGNSAPVPSNPAASSGLSGQLPEDVGVAKLSINGVSSMESEIAKVRFYPNGTCDDLRLILMRPDTREARGIFLEVTTGLADVETDGNKLADEIR